MTNDPKNAQPDKSKDSGTGAQTTESAAATAASPIRPGPHQTEPPPSPTPPRGPGLPTLGALFVFVVVTFVVGATWGSSTIRWSTDTFWSLVPSAKSDDSGDADDHDHDDLPTWYTCGMDPWIILPTNDELCPVCHMELTPIDPSKFSTEISINPIVVQNIGIRIEPVTRGPVERTIRTVGTITFDETRVRDINIKAEGWIEKLYIDFVGATVEIGDPLFDEYSPTLYSAQSEYLSALRMHDMVQPGSSARSLLDTQRLVNDARVQLEYLDVTPEQIAALKERGEPAKTITMLSPHRGVVIAKHANEGMRVDQGMRVFQIADLSKVWVMVSLFEYQLPFLEEGLPVTMSLPYIPGQEFRGEIAYIYPFLDEKTRQVRVRLEFDNPTGLLKPGMFANVELTNTLARDRILAPRSAIIDTGERAVAFVSLGEGRFEPRDVRMGVETGSDQVEILDGLSPGEMVVTSGQFLLDSESHFRESLLKMIRGNLAADQDPVVSADGASELAELPAEATTHLSAALNHYFTISEMLASDTIENIAEPAASLVASVDALTLVAIPGDSMFWAKHKLDRIKVEAMRFTTVRDIETARLAMADLSIALDTVLRATGIPPGFGVEVQELHCPMYLTDQGGSVWIQPAGDVRNPYMGSAMIGCFDERSQLPVTGQTVTDPPVTDPPVTGPPVTGPPVIDPSTDASPAISEPSQDQPPPALSASDQAALDRMFGSYIAMQQQLTRDELAGLSDHLDTFRLALAELETSTPDATSTIGPIIGSIGESATIDTTSLASFRAGYRGLSDAMIELARLAPPSTSIAPAIYHVYCPMEKADWLQFGDEVTNPYAPSMLRCGTIEETFSAAQADGNMP